MASGSSFIIPEWPLASNVKSLITTRLGGVSCKPYTSMNLAQHVGDNTENVSQNRSYLYQHVGEPVTWFQQIHSTHVATLPSSAPMDADGVFSCEPSNVCAVLTADCLPVLFASKAGDEVAAVHCGWRGLAGGIISNVLQKFGCPSSQIIAYLGPAISQKHFEVGEDVLSSFQDAQLERQYSRAVETCFLKRRDVEGKYMADLYGLARSELTGAGVVEIYGGEFCTYTDNRFYSYRRDQETGRFASLIWLT